MYYNKKSLFWGFFWASVGGILLHFLYEKVPSLLTSLVSPVNESLWEHVKIVLFPYLIVAFFLTWDRPTAIRPWLLTALLMVGGMLGFAWFYHLKLNGSALWVDIALFFVVMAFGFWFPPGFSGPFEKKRWVAVMVAMVLLIMAVVYFTFAPPSSLLFQDLATRESFFPHPI